MILRRALEARMPTMLSGVNVSQADGVLRLGFSGGLTTSGVTVEESTAEAIPVVYGCVRILSDHIARSPLLMYRMLASGGREEASEHPLYLVLTSLANPEQTAFDFRAAMMRWLLLWGNAYAEVYRDVSGQVQALWPLRADRMSVERSTATQALTYRYHLDDGTDRVWRYDEKRPPIHHWRINTQDGINGRSPVRLLREAMGLTKAAEEFGSRYFGGGAQPGGVLTTDGKLDEPRAKRMREDWERLHNGIDRSHRIAVLEQGLKFQPMSVPPNDAQFLETRAFQRKDICGAFGVPEFMLDSSAQTAWGSGIESIRNGFVNSTLQPYFDAIQQWSQKDLLGKVEFNRYRFEFDTSRLIRGDEPTRMTAHATALNWRIKTLNEVRDEEGFNPVDGGDVPQPPLSTSSAGSSQQSVPGAGATSAGASNV